jgi:transcriptional regulator with XRE-family HTH domain
MVDASSVRPADAMAARLLVGVTREALAEEARLSPTAVWRLENGEPVLKATRATLISVLEGAGVSFLRPGYLRHIDGRIAPTREAVGSLRGDRLRRARKMLGFSVREIALKARLTEGTLERLERSTIDLTPMPTLGFYRVVGALQLAGYSFAPWRINHRSGDRLLVEPQSRAKPDRDVSSQYVHGLAVPGLVRGLEEPEDVG